MHSSGHGGHKGLQPGVDAPNFNLKTTPDQTVSLEDFRGRPVVLCFYPADWSPVCSDELALYNELMPEFGKYDAQFCAISVDSAWSHIAFARDRRIHFPLLADFHPKGEVAQKYNSYRDSEGVCERALFVIDAVGKIVWSYVSPIGVNPGADGILRALDEMSHQKEVPVNA
jgi:peroxiredoxin